MSINEEVIYLLEEFKIPYLNEFCPDDWKDWYHYILHDPETGILFLYNLCFIGKPETGYITESVFLTLPPTFNIKELASTPKLETYGYARNRKWKKGDLVTSPINFHSDDIFFSITSPGNVTFTVSNLQAGISFQLTGTPIANPVYVPELAPFGNGFIGWGVIPGYLMEGKIIINNNLITVNSGWYCYHDRNFGRFYWGEIGWTWFVFNAVDNHSKSWTYVLHRNNNTDHTKFGSPVLFVYHKNTLNKIFFGTTIRINIIWDKDDKLIPVLPGALASVFNNRRVSSPKKIILNASDGKDKVNIIMSINTFTELIVPDNMKKQYTFIKELSGSAKSNQFLKGKRTFCNEGFFYAELVH
jgi:hypothetical protein